MVRSWSKKGTALLLCLLIVFSMGSPVCADEEDDIRQKQTETQQELDENAAALSAMMEQQSALLERLSSEEEELIDLMFSIDEADDAASYTEGLIEEKEAEIESNTAELAATREKKGEQKSAMAERIRYIYENGGNAGWITVFFKMLSGFGLPESIEYVSAMQSYDRQSLDEYTETIEEIAEKEARLEADKEELLEKQEILTREQSLLLSQKQELQESIDSLTLEKSDYVSRIQSAYEEAERLRNKMEDQAAELADLENKKAEQEAKERLAAEESGKSAAASEAALSGEAVQGSENGGSENNVSETGNVSAQLSSGTSAGEQIVSYACQFLGCPYVWGGYSLTEGCDCSHFVYLVLKDCGVYSGSYMTSGYWADAGSPVASLAEARAGDIIVYSGHVAIYDGQGMIVEAKGSAYGITHDRAADCNPILAIRRFT